MLNLKSTDILRVVTGSAADIEVLASWVDADLGTSPATITPDRTPTASITGAATTTVVASPGNATTRRNVRGMHITNNHASNSTTVAVEFFDGSISSELMEVTLLAGENLILDQNGNWRHKDVNGGEYVAVGPVASQAEMEAGASLTTFVPPGRQHFHPSACKCWGKAVGAGTSLTVNYNVTSVADTGTGRLGVTIATDFSSANYSITASIERGVTTLAVADVEMVAIRNASPAAGVFEIESIDHTATTMVADDPQNYFWQCFGDL